MMTVTHREAYCSTEQPQHVLNSFTGRQVLNDLKLPAVAQTAASYSEGPLSRGPPGGSGVNVPKVASKSEPTVT